MPADNLTSKVLTLLFTDLEGSTALKAKKGDDTASALIAEHRDHINRLAKDYAGRIIDWAGDGCFLTFERPSAAVRFSLNLVQIHQKEGFVTREIVGKVIHEDAFAKNSLKNWIDAGNESPFAFTLRLYKEDQKLKGMVGVDATNFFMPALTGLPAIPIKLDSFFIDRTEVTNKEYQEFIDSGGYKNPEFWEHEFKQNGSIIKWEDAMKLFVDQTGHQGPSTWELGAYPEGQGNYPVSGVSWFEAAAYAKFRGRTIPSIYHWARAALLYDERSNPLSPQIIPLSNMGGTGLAEVASHPGISANGAYDMAGNVREWCYNPSGDERYSLGGDWDDPPYYFLQPTVQSPWERSDGNGFRCAYYPECTKVPASLLQECIQGSYEYVNDPPVSDEMLKIFTNMAAYERTPLNPVIESTQKNKNGWTSETVTIDAAYGSERIILHLDIPIDGNPPYKVVIYFPGLYTMMSNFYSREPHYEPWDFIPKSGRVFVTPVCSGWWERGGGPSIARWYNTHSVQKMFTEWVQDLGRTIDYLETRPDIDSEKVAYLGFSMGALVAPYMIVGEKRIRTAILISGGMGYDIGKFENDNIPRLNSYLPRVKIPILMLNGKYDYTFPFEKTQKPFFNLLGTPLEHKRHVVYEAGHSPLPRVELIKETLAWLDKYQGPVGKKPD